MKIEKPLWIVQPHDSSTEIFRPVRPNAKMIELADDERERTR